MQSVSKDGQRIFGGTKTEAKAALARFPKHKLVVSNVEAGYGSVRVLQEYQRGRIADQDRTVTFSHGLARLFYNRNPALMAVRRLGLLSAALLPGVRRELVMLGSGLRSLDPGLFGEAGLA